VVRLWVATLRVRVASPPSFAETGGSVVSFWHGQQMALLGGRRLVRGAVVLVSRSRDGDLQAGVMTALGFLVVRGSSSRGGATALATLIDWLRAGGRVALAVDGPRGPRRIAKPGAAAAASVAEKPLFPAASAARWSVVLSETWDHFEIPLPFSRVAIVVGVPVPACEARANAATLAVAMSTCRHRAEELVHDGRTSRVAAVGGR
jgi:lysophospholipid acyltransferase (LPLAT)-like uncharacterized protein